MSGQIDTTCVQTHAPSFIGELAGRISAILQKLRAAAPEAEIIVLGAYDPYINALGFADPLFGELNAAIAQSAAANRARFADPFRVFNPQGDLGAEAGTLCTYTLLCVNADSHPSDAGYRALADLVFEASGYSRLMQ
jgi:lysophospholipase L1-like esterase